MQDPFSFRKAFNQYRVGFARFNDVCTKMRVDLPFHFLVNPCLD